MYMAVSQKNQDGSITFYVKGYKPIVCHCMSRHNTNEFDVSTYQPILSADERNIINNEMVSSIIKKLNMQNNNFSMAES